MSIEKYIENYINKLIKVNNQLEHMDSVIRPRNNNNNPGGVVNLKNDIPTMIIPDLHNRLEFLNKILNYKPHNQTVKELLKSNKIQIVFVGDAFHSESAQRDRWLKAYEEYESRFKEHKYMDEEMFSNLKLMEIIIDLKIENPKNVYFLKGNHENVLNEDCEGNRPFGKFVLEGEMVKSWIEKFCSEEFLVHYYRYEKLLPLLAIGENFLVSHAEPLESYTVDQVINCYIDPTIIYGLTWTKMMHPKMEV